MSRQFSAAASGGGTVPGAAPSVGMRSGPVASESSRARVFSEVWP
ncbi:hypothetical protein ACLMAL_35075 [Nocardia sp. CWNU-33]